MRSLFVLVLAAFALSACSDSIPGPGSLVATVVSPHTNEGAAIVTVTGPGITGVSAISGRVFSEPDGPETMKVVVIAEPANVLSFHVEVQDTTADFTGQILEVAGPTDAIRPSLAEYELEIRR